MSDSKRLTLRLPSELHQLLLERADADHRSLNREIEFLLWEAFRVSADAFANTRNAILPAVSPDKGPVRPMAASNNRKDAVRSSRSG
jgi:hypothetical protein